MIDLIQSGHYYHRIVTWSRHDTAHLELNNNHSLEVETMILFQNTGVFKLSDNCLNWRILQKMKTKYLLQIIQENDISEFEAMMFHCIQVFVLYRVNTLQNWRPSWSYGSWIYNYLCNQCLSPLKLWVWILLMVRCTWYNIMWSSLSVTCGRSWFTLGIPISSSNKTDRHDITEILLKVALNTIK